MQERKLRIVLFVSDTNAGGVAAIQRLLVEGISREKFHIIVVACGPGPVAKDLMEHADEYYNLGVGSFPLLRKLRKGKAGEDVWGWLKLTVWLFRCVWRLWRWLRKSNVDIIHSHIVHYNLIAGIAGRLAGVPSVWHIHGSQNRSWRRGGPFLVEGYLASWLASKFIAVSHYTAETFHHSWKRKATVLWNGIDIDGIAFSQKRGRLREMAGVLDHEKLVGVIGLIEYRKGMDRFIQVAAKVAQYYEDVKFIIIGSPINEMGEKFLIQLKHSAANYGIADKVCFAGRVENASCCVGDLDVFFMCSRPGAEALPTVVLEAMSGKVCVVGFSNFSMPEIIEEGKTGFLVAEGDVEGAADKILEILDNEQLANSFKDAAFDRVKEKFDLPVWVEGIEKLYMEILDAEKD
jgi:glycosyltransferase involved in cell wall biosynthesis